MLPLRHKRAVVSFYDALSLIILPYTHLGFKFYSRGNKMDIWTAVIADEDHMIWLRAPNQPLNGPYGDCFLKFQTSFFKYEKFFFFCIFHPWNWREKSTRWKTFKQSITLWYLFKLAQCLFQCLRLHYSPYCSTVSGVSGDWVMKSSLLISWIPISLIISWKYNWLFSRTYTYRISHTRSGLANVYFPKC